MRPGPGRTSPQDAVTRQARPSCGLDIPSENTDRARRLAIANRLARSARPTRDFVSASLWRGVCLLLSAYGVPEIDHQWHGARSEGLAVHATALGLARPRRLD